MANQPLTVTVTVNPHEDQTGFYPRATDLQYDIQRDLCNAYEGIYSVDVVPVEEPSLFRRWFWNEKIAYYFMGYAWAMLMMEVSPW